MRLVLLNQYYAPDEAATAQMLADLGAALAATGHEGTAICCDRSYADSSRRYPRRETIDGIRIVRARCTGFGRSSTIGRLTDYVTFLLGATRQLLFGAKPDVVISLTTPPLIALLGTFCARLRGARSVFWSMDVYPDVAFELGALRRRSLVGRVFSFLSKLTLRTPDVVVALGDSMGARLSALGAKKVVVIHNWAPVESGVRELRAADGASNRFRQERGWGADCVVMYSGNMGMAHEFETVLGAAKKLEAAAGVRFVFVGGGPRLLEVKQRVGELGLSNVEFHPYVAREALNESLSAADLHLVTMREGMQGLLVPSKIYGILGARRAPLYVGPAEGEIHDLVTKGACGTSIRIGDVEGLVAAIRRYRDQPALVAEHGNLARQFYEDNFTRERSVAKFVRLIEDLAPTTSR